MPYEWQGSSPLRRSRSDGDEFVEVGEVFEPTDAEKRAFPRLMREVETDDADETPNPEPEEDTNNGEGYTCAGADGECSREVDEPGGYCWQHEPDD